MSGEAINQPNPPQLPNQLPGDILKLVVDVSKITLEENVAQSLKSFQQAACYIAGAMIFLQDNVFLETPLKDQHVKPRLLGHWGICPGLILVWPHLNLFIKNHDLDVMLVIGPAHGAPAALASLWLEGSVQKFYPTRYEASDQINSKIPGAIHEGGEPGYSLAVSFGAVIDKPDLIVTCVVGDKELEIGSGAASAWSAIKYLDPAESGAVIPIVHANSLKPSERTVIGYMDDKELIAIFTASGYQVAIAENLDDIDVELASSLEWSLREIKKIQGAAREGKPLAKPRWPMIILKTPKVWTGLRKNDEQFIEGSFRSHQIPVPNSGKDLSELEVLQYWLKSYAPQQLLKGGKPAETVLEIIPTNDAKKLGQLNEVCNPHKALNLSDWKLFGVTKNEFRSCMLEASKFLANVFHENPTSFRIFSPNMLADNKLDALLERTAESLQLNEFYRSSRGRIMEVLSEHCCQGFMHGYTLTGRTALFPSHESFVGIVHTMMAQYSKFGKIATSVNWRGNHSSINYIEISPWAHQDHNGVFSHQNPSFIGAILNTRATSAGIYFPPDTNCFLSTIDHCLKSKNCVNLIIGSKQPTPVYLSPEGAAEHCRKGVSTWEFASACRGKNPHVILVGIGVEVTFEVIKAVELLQSCLHTLRVRVVNVTDLMVLASFNHPRSLTNGQFDEIFRRDCPICFNYHGCAGELQGLLFGRLFHDRMTVEGYKDGGPALTPFDTLVMNWVSRFHVAERAIRSAAASDDAIRSRRDDGLRRLWNAYDNVERSIEATGKDPAHLFEMPQFMREED